MTIYVPGALQGLKGDAEEQQKGRLPQEVCPLVESADFPDPEGKGEELVSSNLVVHFSPWITLNCSYTVAEQKA